MIKICSTNFALSVLLLALAINVPSSLAWQASSHQPKQSQQRNRGKTAMSPQQEHWLEEATDRFIARFCQTLDFGVVFDEMFVTDAIERLRKAGFFQNINLSPELMENLEDAILKRTYKAFMNFYYLKTAYDLGIGKGENRPPEVVATIKASKFSNLLSGEGSGNAIITTQDELRQFITDLSKIAALYKKYLPRNVFDSPTYKTSLKTLNTGGRRILSIKDGYEDFGVREGIKVYSVEQDLFIIFFVEENAKLKVLTLGLGN